MYYFDALKWRHKLSQILYGEYEPRWVFSVNIRSITPYFDALSYSCWLEGTLCVSFECFIATYNLEARITY